MRPMFHTYIGYLLIAMGVASFVMLCNSGGRVFSVGDEATNTRARLYAIDNTTKKNQEKVQEIIRILNSRDAIVIPKEP
jgi:hypothetical protein